MAREKASKDKRLLVARQMPPLRRTQPSCEYNYKTDEVFQWIAKRPALIGFLFDKLVSSGCFVYDRDSGYWKGVDNDDD